MNGLEILEVLRLCRTLRRFAIIADYTVPVQFHDAGAVIDWPFLVLACFISPSVDWENCPLRIKSDHPAFQAYLGPSKAEAAFRFAPVHYHEMVLFDSAVAWSPYL